ncbi:MAG: monovalent cation/H+ antiporter complex subunit F [Pseudomonadota bacterium]
MTIESFVAIVDPVITWMLIIVVGALVAVSIKIFAGGSYADRFIAVDMLTGLAIAVCALTALSAGRGEFLDVAFGFALIAFLATVAFGAFLEKKVQVVSRRIEQQPTRTVREGDQS